MVNYMVHAADTRPTVAVLPYPQRSLASVAALVGVATGWLVTLHLLGTLNILFGHPTITAKAVIIASVAGMIVSVFLLYRAGLIDPPEAVNAQQGNIPKAVKVVVALAAVPYAALLLNSLWSYPNGTDAISYHINVALTWLQGGTMRVDPALGWEFALPSNAELPALFALSVGIEKAVAIGNVLAAILLAASVYLIAWRITRQTAPSILSAVVATSIPIAIYQSFDLYVDLFGTAFLVAATALLVWRDKSPSLFIFLSGCAAGVAVGVKPVFWMYGAIYGVIVLILVLRTKLPLLKNTALVAGGIVLTCGFWFLRAGIATGNPLYPFSLPIGHHKAQSGVTANSMVHVKTFDYSYRAILPGLTYPWTELLQDDGRLPVGPDRGTGPLFPTIAITGVVFLLIRAMRRRTRPLEASLLIINIGTLTLWAVLLRIPRFGLPIMALSCALAAPMLVELLDRYRRVLIFLCFAGLMLNDVYCLVEPEQRAVLRMRRHDWSRAAYYGYPAVIDHFAPGTRIFDHAGRVWASALAGVGLTNSVRYGWDVRSGDFILKAGPGDQEDDTLRAKGATQIYDAVPRNLYPKVELPWRIYRVP